MNVLLISQCSKNALVETRRILDQFAERYGDKTWQTPITQQGLATLRMLLKRSARRNTAVACHWIRGKNHTELLWIVGNASLFSEKGTVPTNTTAQNILRQQDENDWYTLRDMQILAAIAALFHDFGKANQAFQAKLSNNSKKPKADAYRHEWVSLRLFEAFVNQAKDDQSWLSRLAMLDQDVNGVAEKNCLASLIKDGITHLPLSPFENMPPVAKAVGWLILTHHFLPQPQVMTVFNPKMLNDLLKYIEPALNNARADSNEKDKKACWNFRAKSKLPFSSTHWRARASYWGDQALKRTQLTKVDWFNDLYSLHLTRLSLMLADHHYSSLSARSNLGDLDFPLFANTDRNTGKCKQRLDEHLIGVAKHAKRVIETLPLLERILPRIARHKGFKQRVSDSRFRWQDHAYDLACSLQERSAAQGFFGVNMASTGCGKTFANGRIMYGLANPARGARFSIALGLRTLTLQTGKAYRERLKLDVDDLAVVVGSTAVKELFELVLQQKKLLQAEEKRTFEACGSESAALLMLDNTYVHYEGALTVGPLKQWLDKKTNEKAFLSAPILVCTVDQLIGATEATRGGKQIIPMLRLLTSDLVLDEPDDFDMADLPALSRLVYWAGMLGSRVLLSSATLPPALIEGLFNAYKAGREMFQKSRGIPGSAINICCAWFDEHNVNASDHAQSVSFIEAHKQFVDKRIKNLSLSEVRRCAIIKPLNTTSQESAEVRQQVADALHDMLHELHQYHHTIDPITHKRVSFGLVRLANIDPLIDIAQYLVKRGAQENHRIKLCCYHSRHPLLIRDKIEKQLDRLLDRRNPESEIFKNQELRKTLDNVNEDNLIFLVLASPVAEVGRDHDYDWAIVEPSSMRSIIQLAGRVRRHREGERKIPNIYLLNTNIKSLENPAGSVTYYRPGFEKQGKDRRFLLNSHKLEDLLLPEQYEKINAEPRINPQLNLMPQENLIDLEHARLQELMLGEYTSDSIPANLWWHSQATLSGILQHATRFRNSQKKRRFALLIDENDEEPRFFDIEGETSIPKHLELFNNPIKIITGERIEAWGDYNYPGALDVLAKQKNMTREECGRRFGWVDLDDDNQQWCYDLMLGLRRKER